MVVEGTFHYADGTNSKFVEVALDTEFGTVPDSSMDAGGSGDPGASVVAGGDGDDVLVGGPGQDTLTGGAGADTFVLNDLDTPDSLAVADVIGDFQPGTDRIDLSGIDADGGISEDQAFIFVDNAATPTVDPGVLANSVTWYQDEANDQTIVQADTSGDGGAEVMVVLTGLHTLHQTDFIL